MSYVANCPICGKEPEVWCRDEEWRIRITCCRHVVYSTDGWNRYAAAMEVSQLRAKYYYECDNMSKDEQKELLDMIYVANKRVLEVFK